MADKILVVEDEAHITRTLRLYLEQAGYQVVIIADGALAMPAFRHEKPDLVILDLHLPHVDGWEICRQIRRDADTPIIMLTARSEESDKLIGLELGADDYVTKPFSPREVTGYVEAEDWCNRCSFSALTRSFWTSKRIPRPKPISPSI